MTYTRFTHEDGTVGSTPVTGDVSGATLALFNRSAAAVEAFYDDEIALLGSKSGRFITEATTETATWGLNAPAPDVRMAGTTFHRLDAAPLTAEVRISSLRNDLTTGNTDACRVSVLPDRSVRIYNQANAQVFASAAGVAPVAAWFRVDYWAHNSLGDGAGPLEVRLHLGLTTVDPLVAYDAAEFVLGGTALTGVRAGKLNGGGILSGRVDDLIVDNGALGRLTPPTSFFASAAPTWTEGPAGTINLTAPVIAGATSYRYWRAPNVLVGNPAVNTPGAWAVIASGLAVPDYADVGRPAGSRWHYAYEGVS